MKSTSQHHTNQDENYQQCQLQDQAEQDADVHHDDDEHAADDSVTEATSTPPKQSLMAFLPTNITIPTEKVGYIFVTSHLQQFLEEYSPSSGKQASLCYIVGLGLNCKFIDLLFKHSIIKFIKISCHLDFIVSEIICKQIDTLTQRLMDLRRF